MLPLSELFPQSIPFLLLAITIFIAFTGSRLWFYALAITLASAFLLKVIDLSGVFVVLGTLTLAFFTHRTNSLVAKFLMRALVIITCIALAAHMFPGFNNLQVLKEVTKNEQSIAYNLFLNFDKPFIIFFILLLFPCVLKAKEPIVLFNLDSTSRLFFTVTLGFILIFTLALGLSLIDYAPKIPVWWWLFALNNLLLTCVAEEVFFRGFVLQKLCRLMTPIAGLAVSSVLFGLAHLSGGVSYILVASIAGFIYGQVYLNTGKLWPAVLTHFILNMIHLSLFTYPLSR